MAGCQAAGLATCLHVQLQGPQPAKVRTAQVQWLQRRSCQLHWYCSSLRVLDLRKVMSSA